MSRRLLSILPLLALAGCYTSEQDLLPQDSLAAPYATIAYTDKEDSLHLQHRLAREDGVNDYVETADDGTVAQRVKLMAVDRQDWYVVEVTTAEGGDDHPNYGYLHVDTENGEADLYEANWAGDGLIEDSYVCGDDLCLGDVDAYVRFAQAHVDQGDTPAASYYISVE